MNFCVDSLRRRNIDPFTPETKKQSKQWTSSGLIEPAPKKAKTVKSDGKRIAISILECTWYNSYQLPSVEANNQWRLLRSFIGPFQQHFKKKNVPIWQRRKSSSIKTMHGFPHARHRWPNSMNSATNCFPIQHIRQI